MEMYLHDVFWVCRSSIRGCNIAGRANYLSTRRRLNSEGLRAAKSVLTGSCPNPYLEVKSCRSKSF